ncbi:MAG: 23S rRNA (guanosine(2251)-2'-O)-methyltransferase RlmB [Deltaproteobacteria bacterium]|nr:23S rRNA (guanosine(2251)-2'-O)-methyltransferase RlmB [Deltaproteobacteria bacterium]
MRVIYGINPVKEALKANPDRLNCIYVSVARRDKQIEAIIEAARGLGVEVKRTPAQEIDRVAGPVAHQGLCALLKDPFRYRGLDELISIWKGSGRPALFLILDSIQDPQNLGSLIRAADAAGAHGVIIPKDRACEVTPGVVKASAGATEHVPILREVNLSNVIASLKDAGVWVAAIEADSTESLYKTDLKGDIAFVIGSEGKGIRRLVREGCDFCVSIPSSGKLNSLNAAQAGAIALFEAVRQRL